MVFWEMNVQTILSNYEAMRNISSYKLRTSVKTNHLTRKFDYLQIEGEWTKFNCFLLFLFYISKCYKRTFNYQFCMSRYFIFVFLILYELYIFTREIFKIFLYTCPLSIHILFYASKGIMYNFSKITVLRYCCCTSSYLIFKMN